MRKLSSFFKRQKENEKKSFGEKLEKLRLEISGHEETVRKLKQFFGIKHLNEPVENSDGESASHNNEENFDYLKESILQ